MKLTENQKQYNKLSKRLDICSANVTKYESGRTWNNIKKYEWQEKADNIIKQMNNITMTDEDFQALDEYYGI